MEPKHWLWAFHNFDGMVLAIENESVLPNRPTTREVWFRLDPAKPRNQLHLHHTAARWLRRLGRRTSQCIDVAGCSVTPIYDRSRDQFSCRLTWSVL